jgi:hypothetical protein
LAAVNTVYREAAHSSDAILLEILAGPAAR